jgi:hypothetical protein
VFSFPRLRYCYLFVITLLFAGWAMSAQAQEADEEYLKIFDLIQEGDSLKTGGQTNLAIAKYQQAQTALRIFQKNRPTWNPKMISYRLSYVTEQIAALSPRAAYGASSTNATGTATAANASESSGGTSSSTVSSGARVKLISAGAEPRQALRLHPEAGAKQTLEINLTMGMDMKIGEMEPPVMKLPAMKMVMETTVKSVAANGDIAYDLVMSDASAADESEVMPQIAEAMKNSMASMKGMTGTGITSSRGLGQSLNIKLPASADPQTRQAMDQFKDSFGRLSTGFPEEPVGVGAKWEVKMPVKSQGMTIDHTGVYELVSLEGEKLTARSAITQTAANQKVPNPAMPGMKLDLNKMNGTGTGDITIDRTQLLPSAGNVALHTDLSMSMDTGGQKQAMTMKMDMNLTLQGK